jgi:hypothetical protein
MLVWIEFTLSRYVRFSVILFLFFDGEIGVLFVVCSSKIDQTHFILFYFILLQVKSKEIFIVI